MPSKSEIEVFGGKDGNPVMYIPKEYKVKSENTIEGYYAESKYGYAVLDNRRILNADFGEKQEEKKDYDLGI